MKKPNLCVLTIALAALGFLLVSLYWYSAEKPAERESPSRVFRGPTSPPGARGPFGPPPYSDLGNRKTHN